MVDSMTVGRSVRLAVLTRVQPAGPVALEGLIWGSTVADARPRTARLSAAMRIGSGSGAHLVMELAPGVAAGLMSPGGPVCGAGRSWRVPTAGVCAFLQLRGIWAAGEHASPAVLPRTEGGWWAPACWCGRASGRSLGRHERAAEWLQVWTDPGRAPRTVDAYARGLAEYLQVCEREGVDPVAAGRAHLAAYVRELSSRPSMRGANVVSIDSGTGLANATLQQRLVAVRSVGAVTRPAGVPGRRASSVVWCRG